MMTSTPNLKEIYEYIQHQLNNLIPERWKSVYLYASVIKQVNNMEVWEMYFYYIPEGLLKKNPVNVYEIPNKFNIDEIEYLALVDILCDTIKKLHIEYKNTYKKVWSNVVIEVGDSQFFIEYNNDDLVKSKYTSNDRHIIFKHKYLNIPIQSFSKREREIIQDFLDNEEPKMVYDRYVEYIPKEEVHNYIEYKRDNGESSKVCSNQLIVLEEKKLGLIGMLLRWLKHRNKGVSDEYNSQLL